MRAESCWCWPPGSFLEGVAVAVVFHVEMPQQCGNGDDGGCFRPWAAAVSVVVATRRSRRASPSSEQPNFTELSQPWAQGGRSRTRGGLHRPGLGPRVGRARAFPQKRCGRKSEFCTTHGGLQRAVIRNRDWGAGRPGRDPALTRPERSSGKSGQLSPPPVPQRWRGGSTSPFLVCSLGAWTTECTLKVMREFC